MIDFLFAFLFIVSGVLAIGVSLAEAKRIQIKNLDRIKDSESTEESKEEVAIKKEKELTEKPVPPKTFSTIPLPKIQFHTTENFLSTQATVRPSIKYLSNYSFLTQLNIIVEPFQYEWRNMLAISRHKEEMQRLTFKRFITAHDFNGFEDRLGRISQISSPITASDTQEYSHIFHSIINKYGMYLFTEMLPINKYTESLFSNIQEKEIYPVKKDGSVKWIEITVSGILPNQSHIVLIRFSSDSKTGQSLPEYYLKITEEEFNNLTQSKTQSLYPLLPLPPAQG